jgi:hypothetical protein
MSESALPPDVSESAEETLSEFLDTALSGTHEHEGPDGDAAGSRGEHPSTDGE